MSKNLIVALLKAKSEFKPIKKDASNPFFKSKYLSLDALLEAVEGALSKNGLLIVQTLSASPNALVTTIYHESGESISGSHPLPDITDPQKFGSAITYARRYSICAILSITADEDDDANTASDRNSNSKPQNSKPQSQGTISREEWLAKQNR
jgi:hypothetical protein